MHPSRLVSIGFVVISVLLLARVGVAGDLRVTPGNVAQVAGGAVLLVTGLYGVFRYEETPIVTEYGPMTYLVVSGLVIWAIGLLLPLIIA